MFKKKLKKMFITGSAALLVVLMFFGFLLVKNLEKAKAESVSFYPASCLGGWKNVDRVVGVPQVTDGDAEKYTEENSATASNIISQIFCGAFAGEMPLDAVKKSVVLKFSWTQKTADPVEELTAPSEGMESPVEGEALVPEPPADFVPEVVPEAMPEPTPGPESPEPVSEPAPGQEPPVSFVEPASVFSLSEKGLVPVVFAQEADLDADPVVIPKTDSEAEISAPTETAPAEDAPSQAAPVENQPEIVAPFKPLDAAAEVLYTLDGEHWDSLGYVSAISNDVDFQMPSEILTDVKGLEGVQVMVRTLSTFDTMPTIYLDSLWFEVQYENPLPPVSVEDMIRDLPQTEIENNDIIVQPEDRKDFQAQEEPTFEINTDFPQPPAEENPLPSAFLPASPFGMIKSGLSFIMESLSIPFALAENDQQIYAQVFDSIGDLSGIQPIIEQSDTKTTMRLPSKGRAFKPGNYKLKIYIVKNNQVYITSSDFSWGVLAINSNQSMYDAGDTAYLQMAVLNKFGHTICDANLELSVTLPNGNVVKLSTEDGDITRNDTCGADNVTDQPDYSTHLLVNSVGTFRLHLANLDNGFSIDDSFEVKSGNSFILERVGATRINPYKSSYQMTLRLTSKKDFVGQLQEKIPAGFEIENNGGGFISSAMQDEKTLIWPVVVGAGQTIERTYQYQAPAVSPEIYLLGTAKLFSDNGGGYVVQQWREIRQWQIASDGACTSATGTINWSAGASWNAGCSGAGGVPTSADDVTITTGAVMTVDSTNPTVNSLTLCVSGTCGSNTSLTIAGGQTLTVNGATRLNAATVNSRTNELAVATGTFVAKGLITQVNGAATNRATRISVTTGTLTIEAGYTFGGSTNTIFNASGAATINLTGTISANSSSFTVNSAAQLNSIGTAAVNGAYTWGKVNVTAGSTLTAGAAMIAATGVQVDNTGTLAMGANLLTDKCASTGTSGFTINGTLSGSGGVTLDTASCTIDGTGSITNTGTNTWTNAKTVASTAALTFTGRILLSASTTVTNNGSIITSSTLGLVGSNATTSIWTQNASTAVIKSSGPMIATGVLNATTTGNTVEYAGAATAIKVVSYYNLTLSGSGTDTGAVTTVTGALVMSGSVAWTANVISSTMASITISGTASLTLGAHATVTGALTLNGGTFNANNKNVSVGSMSSSNSTTRTLTMGSGAWTLSGTGTVWDVATSTNLTFNVNTANISITDTSSSSKTFAGGAKTYNSMAITGSGSGAVIFTGANTFANFTIGAPKTVTLPASTTTTITGALSAVGTSGNLITINSSSGGSAATLSDTSGTVCADWLSLQDSTVSGGATWNAGVNSTSVSGNTGWVFTLNSSCTGDLTINSSATTNAGSAPSWVAGVGGGNVNITDIQTQINAGTNVNFYGANITVSSAFSKTSGGDVTATFKSIGDISVGAAMSASTGELGVVLNSDLDASTSGYVSITAAITSNGGDITIGGGSGTISAGSGFAVGNSGSARGVTISNVVVAAGGGDIIINGQGYNTTTDSNYGTRVTGASAALTTTGNGTINVTGTGKGSTDSGFNQGLSVESGAIISTVDGNLTATGTGGGAGTGTVNYGVYAGGSIKSTGSGMVTVIGNGGNPSGTGAANYGVYCVVANCIRATSTGDVSVTGTGGGGTNGLNYGVYVDAGHSITAAGGAMAITGTGGAANSGNGYGIYVTGASSVISNTGSGTITIIADGSSVSGNNHGLAVAAGAVISTADGNLTATGTGGGSTTGTNNYGVYITGTNSTIKTTGSGAVSVTGYGGNDSGSGTGNDGVYCNVVSCIQAVSTGNVIVTGTGSDSSGGSSHGIYIFNTNSSITAAGGAMTIVGNSGASSGDSLYGIRLSGTGTAITNTGSGTIDITANANGITTSGSSRGLSLGTSTSVISAVDGNVTVTATGGGASGSGGSVGVSLSGAIKTTGSGSVSVTGTGGNNTSGSSGSNYGISCGIANCIQASSTGNVTVDGTGGGAGGSGNTNYGVVVGASSSITAAGGIMTVTGTGGNSSGTSNTGINVAGASAIISNTGSGTTTLIGTGSGSVNSGSNYGVEVNSGGVVSTVNGDLTVTGTGGGAGTGTNNYGAYVNNTNSSIKTTGSGNIIFNGIRGGGNTSSNYGLYIGVANALQTTVSGTITVACDTILLSQANDINSIGHLTIKPYTATSTVGVGSGAGILTLTNTYLTYITWGTSSTLTIGGTTAGDIAINTSSTILNKSVTFLTGGDITLATTALAHAGASAATLTMQAYGNITTTSAITAATSTLTILLYSDYDANASGSISIGAGVASNGGTITIQGGGGSINTASTFDNLTIDTVGNTITLSTALNISGGLTIAAGTLDVTAAGCSGGVSCAVNVAGNWSNSGTFTPRTGTVTLNGINQSLTGDTTFYNLTKQESTNNATDSILTIAASSTQTVTNTLDFDGLDLSDQLNLVSSSPSSRYTFDVSGGGQMVTWLDVTDSNASSNTITCTDCVNGGNNDDNEAVPHWQFGTFLTFSISDNTIGFGNLASSGARYATGDSAGSGSDDDDAHTLSISTNAEGGYTITVGGSTLTSGANTITPIGASATSSSAGSEQFGLRLVVNSGTGLASSPYGSADWALDTAAFPGEVCSGDGDSSTTIYGVRYIGNISADTEAGSYGGILEYIATANF